MSSAQNTGGPAFPLVIPPEHSYSTGMTLRDYFAAEAMKEVSWLSNAGSAKECYEIADAMLKAREQ
jgi:hypothetical protein